MKPFDLAAAKRGEPLYTMLNGTASFIGLKKNGHVVLEYDEGWMESRQQNEVFMAPRRRTVWVNFYTNPERAYYYNTAECADDHEMNCRIGGKAYPVEIDE